MKYHQLSWWIFITLKNINLFKNCLKSITYTSDKIQKCYQGCYEASLLMIYLISKNNFICKDIDDILNSEKKNYIMPISYDNDRYRILNLFSYILNENIIDIDDLHSKIVKSYNAEIEIKYLDEDLEEQKVKINDFLVSYNKQLLCNFYKTISALSKNCLYDETEINSQILTETEKEEIKNSLKTMSEYLKEREKILIDLIRPLQDNEYIDLNKLNKKVSSISLETRNFLCEQLGKRIELLESKYGKFDKVVKTLNNKRSYIETGIFFHQSIAPNRLNFSKRVENEVRERTKNPNVLSVDIVN